MAPLQQIIAEFLKGVRTENANGKNLYCVLDIAAKLGLTRGGIMASVWRLPGQHKTIRLIRAGGGLQKHLFINDDGFLRIAMAGRTKASKRFRKRVTNLELPADIVPPEISMVSLTTPAEVLALEPAQRRDHAIFWIATTAMIAASPRRRETIMRIAASNRGRGGVSVSNCYRYFLLWARSGGDWMVFDRWASLRKSGPISDRKSPGTASAR